MGFFELTTPVVLIVFRRPDTTKLIFDKVRKVKPKQLFVIADGPNNNRIGEIEKCYQVREIIKQVDWCCDVKTYYSEENLTTDIIVPRGLDWVFSQVETAIILEDDCLPDESFFEFCQEMLIKYKNDTRMMLISGNKFFSNKKETNEDSYYFSRYPGIWGWATWKNVWENKFDRHMKNLDFFLKAKILDDLFGNKYIVDQIQNIFLERIDKKIHWDTAMFFSILINNGMSITPYINLVTNIGFRDDAVNTFDTFSPVANVPLKAMKFPLNHPLFIVFNNKEDKIYGSIMYGPQKWWKRVLVIYKKKGVRGIIFKLTRKIYQKVNKRKF